MASVGLARSELYEYMCVWYMGAQLAYMLDVVDV